MSSKVCKQGSSKNCPMKPNKEKSKTNNDKDEICAMIDKKFEEFAKNSKQNTEPPAWKPWEGSGKGKGKGKKGRRHETEEEKEERIKKREEYKKQCAGVQCQHGDNCWYHNWEPGSCFFKHGHDEKQGGNEDEEGSAKALTENADSDEDDEWLGCGCVEDESDSGDEVKLPAMQTRYRWECSPTQYRHVQ